MYCSLRVQPTTLRRLMSVVMCLAYLMHPASPRVNNCTSTLDCSLNGDCVSGQCHCDAAWKGVSCQQLNLVPMTPTRVVEGAYRPGSRTSWGANVLQSPEDGLFHMFVAEMKGNCTLTSWIPNSQVVHAVSTEPDGPFTFREVLFDTFHHNPRLTRAHDGSYLLYMIGGNHSTSRVFWMLCCGCNMDQFMFLHTHMLCRRYCRQRQLQ